MRQLHELLVDLLAQELEVLGDALGLGPFERVLLLLEGLAPEIETTVLGALARYLGLELVLIDEGGQLVEADPALRQAALNAVGHDCWRDHTLQLLGGLDVLLGVAVAGVVGIKSHVLRKQREDEAVVDAVVLEALKSIVIVKALLIFIQIQEELIPLIPIPREVNRSFLHSVLRQVFFPVRDVFNDVKVPSLEFIVIDDLLYGKVLLGSLGLSLVVLSLGVEVGVLLRCAESHILPELKGVSEFMLLPGFHVTDFLRSVWSFFYS